MLPVYTEEDSLEIGNTSEYCIDIPINESILLLNDNYAQGLCKNLERFSTVNKDLLNFELKKQFMQSGLINSELSRAYYELLWKYKLLREKMNLRSKVIKTQKERIKNSEIMVHSLHNSFIKLVEILEKFQVDQYQQEKNEFIGKGKIIRYMKPTPQIVKKEHGLSRKIFRIGTTVPCKNLKGINNINEQNSEAINKSLFLESNLQIQILYNNQLRKTNELLMTERNGYKQLLDQILRFI